ncbi:unnamed protein product [Caenorhabditis nigoni]
MGWFGGGDGGHSEGCEGDWPEDFPQEPEGFKFKCRCPCKCKPKPTAASTTHAATTPSSTAISSTIATTTPSTTPTHPATQSSSPTTTSTSRPTSTSTSTITTTTIPPSSSTTTTTTTPSTPIPTKPEGTFIRGQEVPVAMDESAGGDKIESGTTFWIRSPTPPNTPFPVGGAGPALYATVKIDAPHASDAALAPSNIPSDDDFDIQTVGTPKPPRKVVDPDA